VALSSDTLYLVPTDQRSQLGFVAVLGDVVKSRRYPSRPDLQDAVRDALGIANSKNPAVQPLTSTIGDEFQGLYVNLATALRATLVVRLLLLHTVDVRFGIGWGPLTTYGEGRAPFEQDGPAWWAAREAIDRARAMTHQQEMPRGVRSVFISSSSLTNASEAPTRAPAEEVAGTASESMPTPKPLNGDLQGVIDAFLLCRDDLVASMSSRDAETMLHLLDGRSLSTIANLQGVTLSAVSQRAIKAGQYALREAHEQLREAFP
jgi:DNA-directed RNA polymerase specialized sigma24 family protein